MPASQQFFFESWLSHCWSWLFIEITLTLYYVWKFGLKCWQMKLVSKKSLGYYFSENGLVQIKIFCNGNDKHKIDFDPFELLFFTLTLLSDIVVFVLFSLIVQWTSVLLPYLCLWCIKKRQTCKFLSWPNTSFGTINKVMGSRFIHTPVRA